MMSFLAAFVLMVCALSVGALVAYRVAIARFERAQEESDRNLKSVADSVPQVLWLGLPDGRVTFMNLRWTEITGAPVVDGLADDGWAWQQWFHPEDRQGLLDDWAKARASGEQFESYRRLRHADGTYRWLQVTARPVRDSDGTIVRWYGVSTDIHAEMQAQLSVRELNQTLEQRVEERAHDLVLSERRYRSIFEHSHVALFEQDLSMLIKALAPLHQEHGALLGTYLKGNPSQISELLHLLKTVEINAAALRFLGKERGVVISDPRPGVVDPAPFAELLQHIADGRSDYWEGVVTLLSGDGMVKKAICGVTLVRSPHGVRAYTHLSDITDREHTRELLLEAREELSRANRALTVGSLSMSLAHDLGQPMSAIAIDAAVSQLALARIPPDTATAGKAIERLVASARRASNLLHRTREHAVRRDRTVEPVELASVVRSSMGLLDHEITLQGCKVTLTLGGEFVVVAADKIELQQVIINIILNSLVACKIREESDRLIDVLLKQSDADFVCVEIRDNGVGLPPGGDSRIFEPLYSSKIGSMGMGLAICKAIISSFGGDMTAENNKDRGACFTFSLPVFRRSGLRE